MSQPARPTGPATGAPRSIPEPQRPAAAPPAAPPAEPGDGGSGSTTFTGNPGTPTDPNNGGTVTPATGNRPAVFTMDDGFTLAKFILHHSSTPEEAATRRAYLRALLLRIVDRIAPA